MTDHPSSTALTAPASPRLVVTPAPGPAAGADRSAARRRWALLVLLGAVFMAQFDLFVVNIAAPTLERDLGAGQAALQLMVGGYGFSYAAGLITAGRLGDRHGPRAVFVIGTLVFSLASLLCGLAQTPGELVGARLVQGLGGAAMVPQVLALIARLYAGRERARALGWFGVTIGVGAVTGQVAGGALLQADVAGLGWRAIFLVTVPVGLAAALLALRLVPRAPGAPHVGLDPVGATGIAIGIALLLGPLVVGRSAGWPWWTWLCLAGGIVVLAAALRWERRLEARGGSPVLHLGLLARPVFVRALVIAFGVFASFFSFMFSATLLLQSGYALTALQAGLAFMPLGLAYATASLLSPRLVGRLGGRLITLGTSLAALALLVMGVVLLVRGAATTVGEIAALMALVAFGNGLTSPAVAGVALRGVRHDEAGAAAGMLTTVQQFAGAAGVAALGGVFFAVLGDGHGVGPHVRAQTGVVLGCLLLMLVAVGVSLTLPRGDEDAAG